MGVKNVVSTIMFCLLFNKTSHINHTNSILFIRVIYRFIVLQR